MFVQIILGSVQEAEWPPFGKELLSRLTYVLFVACRFVVLVISQFGVEDRIFVFLAIAYLLLPLNKYAINISSFTFLKKTCNM